MMIGRKPSPVEVVQSVGAALSIIGLLLLLPIGAVCLIVGLAALGLATFVEMRSPRPVDPPTPTPTSQTDGS